MLDRGRLAICLCSDFFFPSVGGIETHIMEIAKQFLNWGHKVVVVTRSNGEMVGEKVLFGKLKVYYLPKCSCGIGSSLLTFWLSAPEMYRILKKEGITHVHGHQTTSGIAFEVCSVAKMMHLPAFYTEHSLFSIAVFGAFHLSKALNPFIQNLDQMIAVSHVQKGNLEARFPGINNITVIPNGIDPDAFFPARKEVIGYPTIVVVTRFEKRRGCEMLPHVINNVCKAHSTVKWIVAGGGSMQHDFRDFWNSSPHKRRITVLGQIVHDDVPEVLRQGHFFLNCSLIDSFCLSSVEAIACGLFVISTNVGGISEVLPAECCTLCEPNVSSLTTAVLDAIANHKLDHDTKMQHYQTISHQFSWSSVAQSLLNVYRMKRSPHSIYYESISGKGYFSSTLAIIYFGALFVIVSITRIFV